MPYTWIEWFQQISACQESFCPLASFFSKRNLFENNRMNFKNIKCERHLMRLILFSITILCFSGLFSFISGKNPRFANIMGAGGTVLGCLIGLVPAASVLWTGQTRGFHRAWLIPFGSFSLQLDALSAFFLFTILILSAVAAVYGNTYLWDYRNRKNLGASWFFFNILVASMVLVVISHNGVLFLMAWEIMSLASFFLVTFEDEKESVRRAGWIYLIATHIGTAFLFVLFILLAHQGPSLDFDHFMASGLNGTSMAGLAFLLSVIGFGTKAGFMPFHVWLPEAHPAAPSHVSAVMSGVMIKTGIYGLLRTLTFLGRPEPWWGWLLIAIGLGSGILGVLFALAQHDLKRLLAYHSVENIGIITLGLGLGVLGLALNQPVLAVLGFGGGLLHVLNHALFKGLLFLGAGAVLHATGVRNIEQLGGLMRHMPWTGTLFLIGSFAICGLPPLNGFVSEFLIYVGAFTGAGLSGVSLSSIGVITGLAAIGGLAAACFTKAFGIVFLGEPRHTPALQGHEIGWGMRIPMLLLALGCLSIGLLSPFIVSAMNPVIGNVTGLLKNDIERSPCRRDPAASAGNGALNHFYPDTGALDPCCADACFPAERSGKATHGTAVLSGPPPACSIRHPLMPSPSPPCSAFFYRRIESFMRRKGFSRPRPACIPIPMMSFRKGSFSPFFAASSGSCCNFTGCSRAAFKSMFSTWP